MIRLEDIHKTFDHNHVLKGISLGVEQGEVVCIIGPSGSGKSTLLRCINYLEVPEEGRIYLDGELAYRVEVGGRLKQFPARRIVAMRRIVLPQAIRIVIPVLGNYFVSLFKDTSLTSALTIQELLFSGQIIAARTYNYFTIYTLVFVLYFMVGYPAGQFVRYLERISKRGYSRKRRVTTYAEPEPLPAAVEPGRNSE